MQKTVCGSSTTIFYTKPIRFQMDINCYAAIRPALKYVCKHKSKAEKAPNLPQLANILWSVVMSTYNNNTYLHISMI